MAFEQKDNGGALFKNNNKQHERHADWNGTMKIEGRDFWINAWIKEGKNGKFFALSFRPKNAQMAKPKLQVVGGLATEVNDEIPF